MAGDSGKRGGGGTYIVGSPDKPKSFIEAYSQIERYYGLEKNGGSIPPEMFTTKNRIEFWEVGFISTFWSGVFSIVMAPLAIGVLEEMIPVFGGSDPQPVDRILAVLLALSFTIGYTAFLARFGRYYEGSVTKLMIRSFMGGIAVSAAVKIVIALILFHFIAFTILDPHTLFDILVRFKSWVSAERLEAWYSTLIAFRGVCMTSAWFVVASTLAYVLVPAVMIGYRIYAERLREKRGG